MEIRKWKSTYEQINANKRKSENKRNNDNWTDPGYMGQLLILLF